MHMGRVFGKSLIDDPYHIHVIQTTLTRSIGSKVPEVYDEIVAAFEDLLPPTADWVKVPTLHKVLNIVVRASNRLFVGLPLCRNEEWKALNIHLTTQVFKGALITNLAPKFIQPLVHWYFNPRSKAFATASKLLRPMIIDRLEKLDSNDEDWESPDDLLAWLIKATDGKRERLNPDDLIFRMLSLNMAAIHTTAFTHALFHLASRPALVKLLRNEMEEAISNEGWTKAAMGKTKMLDSFLKESQRMSSSSAVSVQRVPLRDFTFSNGLVVPAGTLILTSLRATHFDEAYYPNPTEFDAFRSFKKRETENESLKHQMVTPDVGYLAFGTGKHACPGRFFAVNELKLLVTHTLLHYDIRFDDGEEKPHQPVMFGGRVSLDAKTQVMFRKRVM
ncbi:hypothetical protein VNI00_002275 [Paramarasmius palmivorus]|uniref:Cytochrome P450 n=1 Tax=Paramarasmius palmivorus TaxID=297713 RepID=A0AAW0E487_9AGAR